MRTQIQLNSLTIVLLLHWQSDKIDPLHIIVLYFSSFLTIYIAENYFFPSFTHVLKDNSAVRTLKCCTKICSYILGTC